LTLHWDGTQWNAVPNSGHDPAIEYDLKDVATLPSGEAWAVGRKHDPVSGLVSTLTMHWGGGGWALVDSPNVTGAGNQLAGVDTVSANDLWAVGLSFTDLAEQTLMEHFTNPCNAP